MSEFVLDSSAILAVIEHETGWDYVMPLLDHSSVSSVNVAEVITRMIDRGMTRDDAFASFDSLDLVIEDFDTMDAVATGALRTATRHLGLSLGDRACLALAGRLGAVAVTADKAWAREKLPVAVKLIR